MPTTRLNLCTLRSAASHRHGGTETRSWLAGAAWLSLLAVLVAPLAHRAHESGTRHRTCVEHGEPVHVVAHRLGQRTPRPRSQRPALFAAEAALHEHEHCLVTALSAPKIALSPAPEGGLPRARVATLTPTGKGAMAAPSFPRWATAPKQSPPRQG